MLVCPSCGSEQVKQDAYVDPNTQDIIATFDWYFCGDCEYLGKYLITKTEYEKAKN